MNGFDSGFFASLWHQGKKISKLIATLLVATVFFLGMGTILLPVPTAQAAMVLFCPGLDAGGYPYTATYVDGLFTEVRFDRSPSLPPVTSELTYDTVNEQGEPIYRGGYLGMADVTLVDRSKGNVQPGSEVSVAVDGRWNQTRGVCGTSTPTPTALTCPGLDYNGYPYTASYNGGLFTQVRFERPGMPPVTTELTRYAVNDQGEPLYEGGYLGMADVILVDLSKDNVQPGSQVSVAVDNLWNQRRGVCGY
ncbi:MAG: hypothetical protein F6J93_22555 [Oscillatoria sp. SIO1A7]|nr:hypothetical protein [Oscillatoria sp. SIO1A7]